MTNLLKAETNALHAYNLRSNLPDPAIDSLTGETLPRVLLVDDDDLYREALKGELVEAGFAVSDFPDGREALDSLGRGGGCDIVLLDWMIPGMSGLDILRQLKRRNIRLPVIFLTGMPSEEVEASALSDGAVDFIDKTRAVAILTLRMRLAIHSARASGDYGGGEEVACGRLTLKPKVCSTTWDGRPVELTVTEFRIIRHLVRRAGDNVSYREIYDCVHGAGFIAGYGDDGFRTNVRSLIKRIRQKFRAIDSDFDEIENLPSFGYRWRDAGSNGVQ
ncbi:MAG TPA: response regulator transcription factor [Alphaproteobacteria bacterium]|jgi:two-component system response regulator ChvI|nr:response regulator transcription factor [Alphaproteobacteria bacterium]